MTTSRTNGLRHETNTSIEISADLLSLLFILFPTYFITIICGEFYLFYYYYRDIIVIVIFYLIFINIIIVTLSRSS